MKKNSAQGYVILGILFILVSITAFFIPSAKTAVFGISYVFTIIAFVAQIIIWKAVLRRGESLKSKFLGIPIVHVGIVYFVIQIVAFIVFLIFPTLPAWSAVFVYMVIAGVSAVCMIASDIGRSEIERVSAKVREKTFQIKQLQVDVEILANTETDDAIKTALYLLAEKIRFSDPMSGEQLAELEDQITARIAKLKFSVNKVEIINELNSFLDERNRKCKFLK